jgi:hypothetical protein
MNRAADYSFFKNSFFYGVGSNMKKFLMLLAAAGAFLGASRANATPIGPSASVTGAAITAFTDSFGAALANVDTLNQTSKSGKITASLQSSVYLDPTTGTTLDFVYQISVSPNSVDGVGEGQAFHFAGFTTNVGYEATAPAGYNGNPANVIPQAVSRDATGDIITWSYTDIFGDELLPQGSNSVVLTVKTNATQYFQGSSEFAAIDGGTIDFPAFGPQAPVPEPTTLLLAISACATGVPVCLLRRRSRASQATS